MSSLKNDTSFPFLFGMQEFGLYRIRGIQPRCCRLSSPEPENQAVELLSSGSSVSTMTIEHSPTRFKISVSQASSTLTTTIPALTPGGLLPVVRAMKIIRKTIRKLPILNARMWRFAYTDCRCRTGSAIRHRTTCGCWAHPWSTPAPAPSNTAPVAATADPPPAASAPAHLKSRRVNADR